MEVVRRIVVKLQNAIEYYDQTKDVYDLVSDINDIITGLTFGILD